MIKSMTGFGSTEVSLGDYRHRLEVKSVNSKFCDVKVRIPNELTGLDIKIQQYVRSKIARGHVEIFVGREALTGTSGGSVSVNWDLAESYYKAYQSIRAKFGINQDASLAMVTNAREVITINRNEEDQETLWTHFREALDESFLSVIRMREAEGQVLAVDMAGRCNSLRETIGFIAKRAPQVVEAYRKRLKEKIQSVNDEELDAARLAQEVCYFADRCDITEELTRLKSHIQQFLNFLEQDEPVGRRLDFLVQEMNREANTIGSKSSSAEVSQAVVEIKSELEKLREQIQNVE